MKHQTSILFLSLTFLLVNVGNATAQQKHEYVDLDLPSGTLWATCNVGAANPWDYGDYFAWGETTKKTTYSYSNYKYSKLDDRSGHYKMTKYYGYHGVRYDFDFPDTLSILEKIDDVAYQKWGKDWCMPTHYQLDELFENCTYEWTPNYQGKGVAGLIFQSEWNGNTIFFPAAGYKYINVYNDESLFEKEGETGYYWSSVLAYGDGFDVAFYENFETISGYGKIPSASRYFGLTVRPVRCEKQHNLYEDFSFEDDDNDEDIDSWSDEEGNVALNDLDSWSDEEGNVALNDLDYLHENDGNATAKQNDEYVDLGLPSGTLWATCNVGATNPWDYGDYFAWGETTTKSTYSLSNYKYANGDFDKLTKYCNHSSCCSRGMTDCRTTLERKDDVAYQKLGSNWCMPTRAQFQELLHRCVWTRTTLNGKNGYEVEGPNGNSIFLPTAYFYKDSKIRDDYAFNFGFYWSSSVVDADYALILNLEPDFPPTESVHRRSEGLPVRPVRSEK